MSEALCISVTFLDPRYHGRGDGGAPEWPPSPLRLFQALVAGNGPTVGTGGDIDAALRWLEQQSPPTVLAPPSRIGTACPLYVPNNAMDVVAKSWVRGNNEASIAEHRTLKTVRPTHLRGGDTVHYLWPIASSDSDPPPVGPLAQAVERMVALGWGIDLVIAQCRVLSSGDTAGKGLERWDTAQSHATSTRTLRCPVPGSLDALVDRHAAFLNRLADDTFHPVPPLTAYRAVGYRRHADPITRPTAVFELRHDSGKFFRYPHRKLIHISGMIRHLAIEAMKKDPPRGVDGDWVKTYVAGHADVATDSHRQLSYLPLPSIGHPHADPAIRRVMIAAPVGDDAWLDHLARRLAGQMLKPDPDKPDPFAGREPPVLVQMPLRGDGVTRRYIEPSSVWYSFTPVILPGHDDHKPDKTCVLIEKALRQSGIEQPCTFEWSAFSRFAKSFSAHKYDKDKKPQGYYRPAYLNSQTAVHLTLRFHDGTSGQHPVSVPGPLAIGAGRHCGFGLMAAMER
jgi:CRISPR-associated protein Csb2